MTTISIRELHLKTGRWVAMLPLGDRLWSPIAVAESQRFSRLTHPSRAGLSPNREAAIRKRSKVPVDSAVYQAELREDR
jgi:hypothetical protein